MRRIILGLAVTVGVGVCGGRASADPGGYTPPGGIRVGSAGQTWDSLLGQIRCLGQVISLPVVGQTGMAFILA